MTGRGFVMVEAVLSECLARRLKNCVFFLCHPAVSPRGHRNASMNLRFRHFAIPSISDNESHRGGLYLGQRLSCHLTTMTRAAKLGGCRWSEQTTLKRRSRQHWPTPRNTAGAFKAAGKATLGARFSALTKTRNVVAASFAYPAYGVRQKTQAIMPNTCGGSSTTARPVGSR